MRPWSMNEVMMLGILVSLTKIAALAQVIPGIGMYAVGVLVVLLAAIAVSFDPRAIWERVEWVEKDPRRPASRRGSRHGADAMSERALTAAQAGLISCETCGLLSRPARPEQPGHCPRCGAHLAWRRQHSVQRTWAFVVAAAICYVPANILPVLTTNTLVSSEPDTIMSGVIYLYTSGSWPLALIVLVASVMIPLGKLVALGVPADRRAAPVGRQQPRADAPVSHRRADRALVDAGRVRRHVRRGAGAAAAADVGGARARACHSSWRWWCSPCWRRSPSTLVCSGIRAATGSLRMAEDADLGELPQATVVPPKHTRISPVWIIPILAAVVAIGVAVQRILSEGPTITIVFRSAEGIEAGKTFVKYKDVNIGQVTAVRLSEDFAKVEVTAKITKSAAGLMVEDARFWVVRPRITLSGISGLGTLLSGNYIGFEAGSSKNSERRFNGLEVPPIITGGMVGPAVPAEGERPGLAGHRLSGLLSAACRSARSWPTTSRADGKTVELKVFVNAPYDKYVKAGTRFWNASGVDISLSANGFDVRTESLVALLAGGLAFDTPAFLPRPSRRPRTRCSTSASDRATAMKRPESIARHFVLYFKEPLRGLSVGAPVTFFGLQVGEVTDVGLQVRPGDAECQPARGHRLLPRAPDRAACRRRSRRAAEAVEQSPKQSHALLQTPGGAAGHARAAAEAAACSPASSTWPSTIFPTRPRRRSTGAGRRRSCR